MKHTNCGTKCDVGLARSPVSLRALIASDMAAWIAIWQSGPMRPAEHRRMAWKLLWNYCGLRATLLFRISHALWRHRIPLLPGMVGRLNLTLHGLDIPSSVPIGPGLYIPHPVGTVVMAETIGANVTLVSSITIGMRETPVFPRVGDHVFIGAGARVLGNLSIGDGAKIGANAVVLKDIPAGATAVGVPARILGMLDA